MTASDGTVDEKAWKEAVLSIVEGCCISSSSSSEQDAVKLKKLRKQVLLSMQLDDSDKAAKKAFKRTIKALEESQELSLDVDGNVTLTRKGMKRKSKDEKKAKNESKKRRHEKGVETEQRTEKNDEKQTNNDNNEESLKDKNKPCKGNPQGVTRLFLGNLPFAVDETSIGAFLHDKVTHIKWITDKETGKFYGSAFVEMQDSSAAADAVAMAGQSLMGRPIKINFAPARPGDKWPPEKKVITGGAAAAATATTTGGQAGGKGIKAMSEMPDNCVKLFIGNLSYDIDDEGITKFFENVGAEVKAIRWLHHRDTGDFKGCGFVEFWNSEACEKGATLNGKILLGRPIRIDWSD